MLGSERVPLTGKQLEQMVRDGIITVDTKVIRDGETFASSIAARSEFRHLVARL